MKKQLITLLFAIVFGIPQIFSQTSATTINGKKVILNNDGTWEYVDVRAEAPTPDELSCENLVVTQTDKMTGRTITSSKKGLVISDDNKTGFVISTQKGKGALIVVFTAIGAGNCIDDDDKIIFLFTDGSKLEMVNNSDFNCDAQLTLYFEGAFGNKKQLLQLQSKLIQTVRVWTTDGFVQRDFDNIEAMTFQKTIICVLENAK